MPRVNLSKIKTKEERADDGIKIKIATRLIELGMKQCDLIEKSGVPESTARGDFKNPSRMPIYRYRIYCDILQIPQDERRC